MTTALSACETSPSFAGIYDVPEAARYLRASPNGLSVYPVSSAKLIRWIRRGIASPGLASLPGQELLIAFEDLISARVVAALRAADVGWREINRTERWLRTTTGSERPFATEHLWTGQGQVFVDWTDRLLSASRGGQLALEMLTEYLIPIHGLQFSEDTHVATSWEPATGIVLMPEIQFGAPCIKGTRIPARTIAGMVEAGDSPHWVASTFDISHCDVVAACDWESLLRER